MRVHVHEVWRDEAGGSHLGSPAFSDAMRELIEGNPYAARSSYHTRSCNHPQLSPSAIARGADCPTCGGLGQRPHEQQRYRRPMHAALSRLRYRPVRDGLPPLDLTLRMLAMSQGDLARAALGLARTYPRMGATEKAASHIGYALRELRRVFADEPAPRVVRTHPPVDTKSEAQSVAEAAA